MALSKSTERLSAALLDFREHQPQAKFAESNTSDVRGTLGVGTDDVPAWLTTP